ncbi:MAG TPA: methyl-accepting chemotaxis protein [Metabacillus sp.]|nr:methyl-accepting chemotaxis protein [Metabacillus sp.]
MIKTLKAKLFLSLLVVSIVPLLVVSIVLYLKTNQGYDMVLKNEQDANVESMTERLNSASTELLELTKFYANQPEIIKAFKQSNRESVAIIVKPIFDRLQREHHLDVFELGNEDGTVFFRGHNPQKYGDDKSDKPAVLAALENQTLAGFEFGNSGLAVRAFVPIVDNNEVIGTLQTGLDGKVIESITQSMKGIRLTISNIEGEILVASEEEDLGDNLNHPSILKKVLNGEEVSNENEESLEYYMPLFDPTKTEVIGIIKIVQDTTIIQQMNNQVMLYLIFTVSTTLVIVIIVALYLSRSFSTPIKEITLFMKELAKGNLQRTLNHPKRNDEIGQLSQSVVETQLNMRDMLKKISSLSTTVLQESMAMKDACLEMNEASHQVAATMQEISLGSEEQASTSSDLAQQMDNFTRGINQANKNGSIVQAASTEVLHITNKGDRLMNESIHQMDKLYEMMKLAVEKVDRLEQQSMEISKLVNVIQGISDQTNLLALNAAIEAARAGEHGRGFAVVANEVRNLADQVSNSISDITAIVVNIQSESNNVIEALTNGYKEVEEGSNQIRQTGKAFHHINDSVSDMANKVENITSQLSDIADNSQLINQSIDNIASISQESAASIEETTATFQQTNSSINLLSKNAGSLEKLSDELQEMVKRFQL